METAELFIVVNSTVFFLKFRSVLLWQYGWIRAGEEESPTFTTEIWNTKDTNCCPTKTQGWADKWSEKSGTTTESFWRQQTWYTKDLYDNSYSCTFRAKSRLNPTLIHSSSCAKHSLDCRWRFTYKEWSCFSISCLL